MQRIISFILRRVARRGVMKGGSALLAQGRRLRAKRKIVPETLSDGSPRRKRRPDERPGDEVLYPTDVFTEPMQPRR